MCKISSGSDCATSVGFDVGVDALTAIGDNGTELGGGTQATFVIYPNNKLRLGLAGRYEYTVALDGPHIDSMPQVEVEALERQTALGGIEFGMRLIKNEVRLFGSLQLGYSWTSTDYSDDKKAVTHNGTAVRSSIGIAMNLGRSRHHALGNLWLIPSVSYISQPLMEHAAQFAVGLHGSW